jgi:hypothetical protein
MLINKNINKKAVLILGNLIKLYARLSISFLVIPITLKLVDLPGAPLFSHTKFSRLKYIAFFQNFLG